MQTVATIIAKRGDRRIVVRISDIGQDKTIVKVTPKRTYMTTGWARENMLLSDRVSEIRQDLSTKGYEIKESYFELFDYSMRLKLTTQFPSVKFKIAKDYLVIKFMKRTILIKLDRVYVNGLLNKIIGELERKPVLW